MMTMIEASTEESVADDVVSEESQHYHEEHVHQTQKAGRFPNVQVDVRGLKITFRTRQKIIQSAPIIFRII